MRTDSKKHFFVVDDSPVFRRIVCDTFQNSSISWSWHESVALAADAFESEHPRIDAIFFDFLLESGNTWTSIQKFRERAPHLPLFIISALPEPPSFVKEAIEKSNSISWIPRTHWAQAFQRALSSS